MNSSEVEKKFKHNTLIKLKGEYSRVVSQLIDVFTVNNVDVKKLITVLHFNDADKISIFSTDTAFSVITTVVELFNHVANYCKGIYDYEVLIMLVQASGSQKAIEELDSFTTKLQNSVLSEIDLMSEHGELMHPDDFMPGTYKFIIQYVGGKCDIRTMKMVKGIVEQCINLKKGVLIFKGFGVGSILFIYQISVIVKDYLLQYNFTKSDFTFLKENRIASLTVDGVTIIDTLKVYSCTCVHSTYVTYVTLSHILYIYGLNLYIYNTIPVHI